MELSWTVGLSTGIFLSEPLPKVLETIKATGFRTIEVTVSPLHFDYHNVDLAVRIRRELEGLGLKATSLHAPYSSIIDPTYLDEEYRRRAVAEIKAAAQALITLGGTKLVMHPGSESPEAKADIAPRLKQAAKSLKELHQYCQERGISLVLESMLGHLLGGSTIDLQWLLAQLPREGTGICLDTGHSYLAGSLLERVKLFAPQLMMLHAHDNNGVYDDHLAPGEGNIDWPSFIAALRQVNFKGEIVIEMSAGENALERARRSVAFLESCCRDKGCRLTTG